MLLKTLPQQTGLLKKHTVTPAQSHIFLNVFYDCFFLKTGTLFSQDVLQTNEV